MSQSDVTGDTGSMVRYPFPSFTTPAPVLLCARNGHTGLYPTTFLDPSASCVHCLFCLCFLFTHSQDVLSFVEFKQHLDTAQKYHTQALRYIQDFWYLLLRKNHDFSVLWRATRFINNADRRADESYQLLLNRYPKASKLWRNYGSFLLRVRADPRKAVRGVCMSCLDVYAH